MNVPLTLLILFIVLLMLLFIGGLLNANKGPECESDISRLSPTAIAEDAQGVGNAGRFAPTVTLPSASNNFCTESGTGGAHAGRTGGTEPITPPTQFERVAECKTQEYKCKPMHPECKVRSSPEPEIPVESCARRESVGDVENPKVSVGTGYSSTLRQCAGSNPAALKSTGGAFE